MYARSDIIIGVNDYDKINQKYCQQLRDDNASINLCKCNICLKNRRSVIGARSLMIGLVHHLSAPIIHCLLLQLKMPEFFSNGQAVGNRAIVGLTLSSVNLEEGPDAFADIAPAVCFDLATITVFEKSLHLGTVGRVACGGSARGGVQE